MCLKFKCLKLPLPSTAVLREAWATLHESSSRPLPATLAQTRNLAIPHSKPLYKGYFLRLV